MGTNSTIAVIDLHEANKGSQYARCKSVQQLQLQEFTREGYTGGGEWLIYGGTDAIVGSASSLEMERIQGKDTLSVSFINAPSVLPSRYTYPISDCSRSASKTFSVETTQHKSNTDIDLITVRQNPSSQ